MTHTILFHIQSPDASLMYQAMIPEEETEHYTRSRSRCNYVPEEMIEIQISADDLPSLRAATNTWLRLVQIASEMIQISKKLKNA